VPPGRIWPGGSAPPSPGYRGRPTRSYLSHVERDNPVGVQADDRFGGLTVREAELPGGRRTIREANAGDRKATGNRDQRLLAPPCQRFRITGRIGAVALA
jgi:hypothetical protein